MIYEILVAKLLNFNSIQINNTDNHHSGKTAAEVKTAGDATPADANGTEMQN